MPISEEILNMSVDELCFQKQLKTKGFYDKLEFTEKLETNLKRNYTRLRYNLLNAGVENVKDALKFLDEHKPSIIIRDFPNWGKVTVDLLIERLKEIGAFAIENEKL